MSTKRTTMAACSAAVVAIAAAAFAGIGVTAAPRVAADPCGNWRTNSPKLILNLANGQTANFALSRPNAFSPNPHSSNLETGGDGLHDFYAQAITGVPVEGKTVDFTVSWSDLDGTDITSHFTGSVGDDGVARGTAVDNKNFQVDWTSQGALSCADQATPPGVAPPPYTPPAKNPAGGAVTPAKQTVTILQQSDVYDAANGNHIEEPFFLEVGRTLDTVSPCTGDWCLLSIPDLPGAGHGKLPDNQGFIYTGLANGDKFVTVNG
jgi:hypothetical protein